MEDKIKREVYIVTPHLYEMFYPSPQFIEPVVKKAYIKYEPNKDDELFLLSDKNGEDIAVFDKKHMYHSYKEACDAKIHMMERQIEFLTGKESEIKDVILKYKKMLNDILDCKQTLIKQIKPK